MEIARYAEAPTHVPMPKQITTNDKMTIMTIFFFGFLVRNLSGVFLTLFLNIFTNYTKKYTDLASAVVQKMAMTVFSLIDYNIKEKTVDKLKKGENFILI